MMTGFRFMRKQNLSPFRVSFCGYYGQLWKDRHKVWTDACSHMAGYTWLPPQSCPCSWL